MEEIEALARMHTLIPVCPEQLGGLATPRVPVEIKDGEWIDANQNVYTQNFERGAQECLRVAKLNGCKVALLKERSPSCGVNQVYDGSFSGKRVKGMGMTARQLERAGIKVFSEEELEEMQAYISRLLSV